MGEGCHFQSKLILLQIFNVFLENQGRFDTFPKNIRFCKPRIPLVKANVEEWQILPNLKLYSVKNVPRVFTEIECPLLYKKKPGFRCPFYIKKKRLECV